MSHHHHHLSRRALSDQARHLRPSLTRPRPQGDLRAHLRELRVEADLASVGRNGPGESRFGSINLGWNRVYGGQLAAQALMASSGLIASQKELSHQSVNSFRIRFVGSGDVKQPVTCKPEIIRAGRTFSWVSVDTRQEAVGLLTSSVASFKSPFTGGDTSDPKRFLQHDDAQSNRIVDQFSKPEESPPSEIIIIGFDMRIALTKAFPLSRALWVRRLDHTEDWTRREEQGALAYVSDYFFLRSALHKHDIDFYMPHVRAASLCHSIFFHRTFDLKDWTLFIADAPVASDGRALVEGQFIRRRDGAKLASVLQEGLVWNRAAKPVVVSKPQSKPLESPSSSNGVASTKDLVKLFQEPSQNSDGSTRLKEFGWGRPYGGQLIAQSLLVANKVLNSHGKLRLHSFHGHFVQAGKSGSNSPLTHYEAKVTRAGNIYTVGNVAAKQEGRILFRGELSFARSASNVHKEGPGAKSLGSGLEHDDDLDNVEANLKRFQSLQMKDHEDAVRDWCMPFPFRTNLFAKMGLDFRQAFDEHGDVQRAFVRPNFDVNGSGILSQAILAYASDCLFPVAGTIRHYSKGPYMWAKGGTITCASLCCSLYFHRDFVLDPTKWIVMRTSCSIIEDERALAKIDFFDEWGARRIATGFQEVLIRGNPK